ncbi:exodeoxyribonuclease VII large subunit [candidate division KSB1 bacterium]|nr:exodeoxyribonuclease VII large subunit [candidate division KSB1 bacterium]
MLAFELESSENNEQKLTVTELTREIKQILEDSLPLVWVVGEISNYKLHSSGHIYFSLKDENAQIACVLWRRRASNLFFTPRDGMKVVVQGQVTVYEKRGSYQLDVQQMQPAGIGELQLAFEALKSRLAEEGLFNSEFKKPLPRFPETIGIVTSPTGAAIQDLIQILLRRFPPVEIILRPVKVQGEGAAVDIATAIGEFNEFGQVDLLIVGRGGGSIEDLWAFNEEVVARAIFQSKIPIISAVGHEVDFCISDFVADLRAPTPSAAAELAVPDANELRPQLMFMLSRMHQRILELIDRLKVQVKSCLQSYGFRQPVDLLRQYHQRLDEIERTLQTSIFHRLALTREKYTALEKRLQSLNPKGILARGYSICYQLPTREIVREAKDLKVPQPIEIHFYKGKGVGEIHETGET